MIIIFCEHITNRVSYTVKTIFKDILNIHEVFITDNKFEFENSSFIKINYSISPINNTFKITPADLLFQNTIDYKLALEFSAINNEIMAPYAINDNNHIEFDVFSAVFFIISRYEEYLSTAKDKHNRYPATQSVLYKYALLDIPVINLWAEYLLKKLNSFYHTNLVNQSAFKCLFTFDIDIAYAYKNKAFIRNVFSLANKVTSLKFKSVRQHIRVLQNKQSDPFDTYDYFLNQLKNNNIDAVIFILLGNHSAQNINLSYKNKAFRNLIKQLAAHHTIGIHPSYKSSDNNKILNTEINRLRKIINQEIIISRQHYLKFNLPYTYQHLIQAGIQEDYSMAYANITGFRAGTCSVFNWYDLSRETETNLRIFPTSLMDGTLNEYLHLNIHEAMMVSEKIITCIKKYKGSFIPLWHNNTLSNTGIWSGWREVFEKQIEECIKK